MKRLALALLVFPGAALAHGGHPPVPEAAHGWAHAAPVAAVVAVVILALLWWRARS